MVDSNANRLGRLAPRPAALSSSRVKPRPKRTLRLYLTVGQRTAGRRAPEIGRGEILAALLRRARRLLLARIGCSSHVFTRVYHFLWKWHFHWHRRTSLAMVKHNHAIQKCHFHKKWQTRVKTWLEQPMRAKRRRLARLNKAAKISPRPISGALRPAVRCPTVKYNRKVRFGRGFTLDELKAAGLGAKQAQSIGIAVDHRRKNRSEESLQANVQRSKTYKANLVVFPRRMKKPKAGDGKAEELSKAEQLTGNVQPIAKASPRCKAQKDDSKAKSAYTTMRIARSDAKYVGVREKRAKEKEEKAKAEAAKQAK